MIEIGNTVVRRKYASGPYIIGDVLLTFQKSPGSSLQLVLRSAAHDKLQVVWADQYELYVGEEYDG